MDTIFILFFIERLKVFYFCFCIFERTFGTYSSVSLTYKLTSPGYYYYYSRHEIRIFTTIIVALPSLSLRCAPSPTSYRYSVCCMPNVHASVRNQLTYLLWAEGRLIKRKTEWTTTRTSHAVPCVNVDTDHTRIWISQGDIVNTLIFSVYYFFYL